MLHAQEVYSISEHSEGAVVVVGELTERRPVTISKCIIRVLIGTYFAMLRCTNMSPGRAPVMTASGTLESAQPIQSV